jgi:hypothetical protein
MTQANDEIARKLRTARATVDAAELPEKLRAVGLALAYQDLAGSDSSAGGRVSDTAATVPVDAIAYRLDVPEALVHRVFDLDEEGVHLVIPRSSLDKRKSEAMRQVARLLVAARQAAGIEGWTDIGLVRDGCDGLGVLDASNFATEIMKLHGDGIRIRGARAGRELKMNQAGFESTGSLVLSIAASEG